jgi:hypothetical protein
MGEMESPDAGSSVGLGTYMGPNRTLDEGEHSWVPVFVPRTGAIMASSSPIVGSYG